MKSSAKRGRTNTDNGDEAKTKVKRRMLARVLLQGKVHRGKGIVRRSSVRARPRPRVARPKAAAVAVVAEEEAAEAVAKAGSIFEVVSGDAAALCPEQTKALIQSAFPDLSNIGLNPEVFVHGRLLRAFKAVSSKFSSVDLFVHGTADASVKSIFKTSLHTGFCGACFFTRDVSTAASYAARHAGTRRRVVIFAVALEEHEAAESVRIIYTPAGHARSRRHLPLASALLPERDQPTLH